jgi:hypothetical protein
MERLTKIGYEIVPEYMEEVKRELPWLFGAEITEEEWLFLLGANLETHVDREVSHVRLHSVNDLSNPNGDVLYSDPDGAV